MQQQPRRAFWALLVPAKTEGRQAPEDVRSGPAELDVEVLRHVAGGNTDTPKRTW